MEEIDKIKWENLVRQLKLIFLKNDGLSNCWFSDIDSFISINIL